MADHLDIARSRDSGSLSRNKLTQPGVFGLRGIDDQVAIDQHPPALLGKARSWRCWRCQITGSAMEVRSGN